jgi:hypothetical protein
MDTFNKKSLCAALAGLGALGAAGTASAVYVNPDGLGQVLIYPYYTVRSDVQSKTPFTSLLSVVNSTASTKAVKVRFLEGKNSREVLDFNLFLSPHDVWTAGVFPTVGGAGVASTDKSCILPAQLSTNPLAPTPFLDYVLTDAAGADLDRSREGYVEILEMSDIKAGSTTAKRVVHVNGVPPGCAANNDVDAKADSVLGDGGLFGSMTIINVLGGVEFTSNATALAAWNTAGSLYASAGLVNPTLEEGDNTFSLFTGTSVINGTANNGRDAVSIALMHHDLMNEYVLDSGTASGTDWIVNFPTKRFYYTGNNVQKFFQRNFTVNGACDDISVKYWDREEQSPTVIGGFSPPPPDASPYALCWEANVVTFNGSNVFNSKNSANLSGIPYQNGWALFDLYGPAGSATVHTLTTPSSGTYTGLPVIGFEASTFNNRTVIDGQGGAVRSIYGGTYAHRFTPAGYTPPAQPK